MEKNSETKNLSEESSTTNKTEASKESEAVGTQKAKDSILDRAVLVPGGRSTRSLISLILGTLALVSFIWLVSPSTKKDPVREEVQEYTSNFKPGNFSVYTPPLSQASVAKDNSGDDKKAKALKEARIKSAMVIYQNYDNASNKTNSSSSQSAASDPNLRFQQELENSSVPVSTVRSLGSLKYKILQGKMLSATLETAVNSDLPGMVRAVLSYNVYGETGRQVLLPRGSRLIGQYNSAIRKGQARVFLVWSRAILPNGHEIMLHSAGTDNLGRAGIRGRVNNHFWQIFGTSALLSVLGATTANVGVDTTDQYNSISAYREDIAASFQESSAQVLDRYIDIPPTIEVRPGTPIKIFVARDLDFSGQFYSAAWERRQSAPWVIRP